MEEQGGDISLPGIGGFAGATEGRSCLFSVFFLGAAAFLSALALASAFFCLGFRLRVFKSRKHRKCLALASPAASSASGA
jgi:hypothetical protein